MITPKFTRGDLVEKISGSDWFGTVVGEYSTDLTPEGYCVESIYHRGSVQIYPAAALRLLVGPDPSVMFIPEPETPAPSWQDPELI